MAWIKRIFEGTNALSSADAVGGRLRRTVRPDGQKGAPNLEDGRNPRESAAPRKRRCAARMISAAPMERRNAARMISGATLASREWLGRSFR